MHPSKGHLPFDRGKSLEEMSKGYTVDEVLGQLIAEGVERESERNLWCQQHCDEMQGDLFIRPLTAKGFQQLLFS